MSKFLDLTGLGKLVENLNTKFDEKVDKVPGKGLSTNDFTDEYKQKIDSVSDTVGTDTQAGLTKLYGAEGQNTDGAMTQKAVTDALAGKVDSTLVGATSGIAELDETGKVPASQLPSYVDDVVEGYFSENKFYEEDSYETEITGESGKIYMDLTTNKTYRWSGTAFVEISQSLALGETSSTAYRGDKGKIAYDHSQAAHAPSDAEANQNAFSNVKVGETTVAADAKTDTVTFVAGTNVQITADASGKSVTVSATDTKYNNATTSTAGLMSAADKTKLDEIEAITEEEIIALFTA